jgi:uncharacterized protein YbjT (DUF2867 family)
MVARTASPRSAARSALLAGASGLVGRALLAGLLASDDHAPVHALLRRSLPDLPAHPRLAIHVVDFDRLPPLPHVDDAFIALGTTIKAAGSQAAFRRVDFDAVLATARAAQAAGATQVLVVSALGADAHSRVFYNRVKGEMQRAVAALGFRSVVFAQPSLLLGDRAALGQPPRAGEALAQRLVRPVLGLLPRSVRPIRADAVARALLQAARAAQPGVRVLVSAQMQDGD